MKESWFPRSSRLSKGLVIVILLTFTLMPWLSPAQAAPGWTNTGAMGSVRSNHTATLLTNTKVLITGGYVVASANASAELYDPGLGTFTSTGAMGTGRFFHTATLLDDGRVLIAGGWNFSSVPNNLDSAELYDPLTGAFTSTGAMADARDEHTATLLGNGKVLILGGRGIDTRGILDTAELYDPATGGFSSAGVMGDARYGHTATLLENGKVLIAGGTGASWSATTSAELYDPVTGGFSSVGVMGTARYGHSATLLTNGKVLVAGQERESPPVLTAELYNPATGTFSSTGSLGTARQNHSATLMRSGKVLIAGGVGTGTGISSAELYDPVAGTFAPTASMGKARYDQTATRLWSGDVLVTGGHNTTYLSSAEIYLSDSEVAAPTFSPTPGTYDLAQSVAIMTTTPGASARYTTDGVTPPTDTVGTEYTAPIPVATNMTIMAVAYRAGWTTSVVSTGVYAISTTVADPTFSPAPGRIYATQPVTISTTSPGATIRYTTDGVTAPTDILGTVYSGSISVGATTTIKAVAYKSGLTTSSVSTGEYTMAVASPVFRPSPGSSSSPFNVTITATAGATIRYTTDGSTPTEIVGTEYTGAIYVGSTTTIKAVAYKAGLATSFVTAGTYIISPPSQYPGGGSSCSISRGGKSTGESPWGTILVLFSPGIFLVLRKIRRREQNLL